MGMAERKISDAVIRRLPRYHRHLAALEKEGVERISSRRLSAELGLTASQIRQDLNCFGGFGQQGYGYSVPELRRELGRILGLQERYKIIIAGAGHIGRALLYYAGFKDEGFDMLAAFDVDEELIGQTVNDARVYHMDEMAVFIKNNQVDIGVIASPRQAAQQTADAMVENGIRAIWNFAPADIHTPEQVHVENVRLSDSLCVLSYYLQANRDEY